MVFEWFGQRRADGIHLAARCLVPKFPDGLLLVALHLDSHADYHHSCEEEGSVARRQGETDVRSTTTLQFGAPYSPTTGIRGES